MPKLLDLRRIEGCLAKRGDYLEAHKVKLQADALEAEEAGKAMGRRDQHLHKLERALLQRQDAEVNALRQRISSGAEEQRVARQHDLDRLMRRYHNAKAELDATHRAETTRHRKGVAALPGALGSRASSRALALGSSSLGEGTSTPRRSSSSPRAGPTTWRGGPGGMLAKAARPMSRPASARAPPNPPDVNGAAAVEGAAD